MQLAMTRHESSSSEFEGLLGLLCFAFLALGRLPLLLHCLGCHHVCKILHIQPNTISDKVSKILPHQEPAQGLVAASQCTSGLRGIARDQIL